MSVREQLRAALRVTCEAHDPTGTCAACDRRLDAVLPVIDAALEVARGQWLDRLFAERGQPDARPAAPHWRTPDRRGLCVAKALTAREREALSRIVLGEDVVRAARAMRVTGATARCHLQNARDKLRTPSLRIAVIRLVQWRLVDVDTGEWHPAVTGAAPPPPAPARPAAARAWQGRA